MTNEGVDLLNPEAVQEYLAKKEWRENTKFPAAVVYEGFAKAQGLQWERPRYKPSRKLPFVPLESEVDQLVACSGRNISALLQLLKETGMRLGEALSLKWTDLDLERNGIILNTPEKGSDPRAFKVTTTLIDKLNQLPKTQETIFHNRLRQSVSSNFRTQRKRIAAKLGNPRLEKITLRTLRHFKATMEYAKTRDILNVMSVLGHKNEVIGTILNFIDEQENKEYKRKRGHVELISVQRPWRGRGIAKAMIARSLKLLKDRGMTEAALGVDSENPSGAFHLYQKMGFKVEKRVAFYRKSMA